MSLAALIAGAEPLDGGFALGIADTWHQGRTVFGGLSAALALTAAKAVGGPALPPLRSVQVSFVGPLHGDVEVRARVLRSGKNATWIAADITRNGEVGLTATFVFMGPVDSALHLNDRPAPQALVPVDDAPPFAPREYTPQFLRHHFDVRFAQPRGGDKLPEICWWVRAKDHAALDPMTGLMLIADSLPPGVLPLLHPGVPVSSMTWLANLLTPVPQTRDGWWLLRSTGDYAEKGCSSQRMAIWNSDGVPVIAGMQSVAVFG